MDQQALELNCTEFLIEQGLASPEIRNSKDLFQYHWRIYCLRYHIPFSWPIDWNNLSLNTTIALERIENERKAKQINAARNASSGTMRTIPIHTAADIKETKVESEREAESTDQTDTVELVTDESAQTVEPVTETVEPVTEKPFFVEKAPQPTQQHRPHHNPHRR